MRSSSLHVFDGVEHVHLLFGPHLLAGDDARAEEAALAGAVHAVDEYGRASVGARLLRLSRLLDETQEGVARPRHLLVHAPRLEAQLSHGPGGVRWPLAVPQLSRTRRHVVRDVTGRRLDEERRRVLDGLAARPVLGAAVLHEVAAVERHDRRYIVVVDELPKVSDGRLERGLRHDEAGRLPVAVHVHGVDVVGVSAQSASAPQQRPVGVGRHDRTEPVLGGVGVAQSRRALVGGEWVDEALEGGELLAEVGGVGDGVEARQLAVVELQVDAEHVVGGDERLEEQVVDEHVLLQRAHHHDAVAAHLVAEVEHVDDVLDGRLLQEGVERDKDGRSTDARPAVHQHRRRLVPRRRRRPHPLAELEQRDGVVGHAVGWPADELVVRHAPDHLAVGEDVEASHDERGEGDGVDQRHHHAVVLLRADGRPVALALHHAVLLKLAEENHLRHALLVHQLPEIADRHVVEGTLRRDVRVATLVAVHVARVDVVGRAGLHVGQHDAAVVVGEQVLEAVLVLVLTLLGHAARALRAVRQLAVLLVKRDLRLVVVDVRDLQVGGAVRLSVDRHPGGVQLVDVAPLVRLGDRRRRVGKVGCVVVEPRGPLLGCLHLLLALLHEVARADHQHDDEQKEERNDDGDYHHRIVVVVGRQRLPGGDHRRRAGRTGRRHEGRARPPFRRREDLRHRHLDDAVERARHHERHQEVGITIQRHVHIGAVLSPIPDGEHLVSEEVVWRQLGRGVAVQTGYEDDRVGQRPFKSASSPAQIPQRRHDHEVGADRTPPALHRLYRYRDHRVVVRDDLRGGRFRRRPQLCPDVELRDRPVCGACLCPDTKAVQGSGE